MRQSNNNSKLLDSFLKLASATPAPQEKAEEKFAQQILDIFKKPKPTLDDIYKQALKIAAANEAAQAVMESDLEMSDIGADTGLGGDEAPITPEEPIDEPLDSTPAADPTVTAPEAIGEDAKSLIQQAIDMLNRAQGKVDGASAGAADLGSEVTSEPEISPLGDDVDIMGDDAEGIGDAEALGMPDNTVAPEKPMMGGSMGGPTGSF